MTALIIVSLVLIILGLLFVVGGKNIDEQVPPLDLKYSKLVSLLNSTRGSILDKRNNLLVIGVKTYGGETLFTIKETVSQEVSIVYSIKNNPTCADFELRYIFSQASCLHNPGNVVEKINQDIASKIQELYSKYL